MGGKGSKSKKNEPQQQQSQSQQPSQQPPQQQQPVSQSQLQIHQSPQYLKQQQQQQQQSQQPQPQQLQQPQPQQLQQPQQQQPQQQAANDDEEVKKSAGDENIEFKDTSMSNPEEFTSFWDRNKTFKPQKKAAGKKQSELQKTIRATMKATLGGGELKNTVKLPEGEDENEWIAVNTIHFYNAANMIYGTCAEFCTDQSCPLMSAGPKYEYLWKDGVKYKKPTKVSAPVYIDNLLNWVNDQLSNTELFPVDENAKLPKNFKSQVKQIYKRLFRLYAHLYYSHFEQIRAVGANAHLNTCFKHFVFFIQEFDLVDPEEMAPLKKLISKFSEAK